jgi:hypothetical protein
VSGLLTAYRRAHVIRLLELHADLTGRAQTVRHMRRAWPFFDNSRMKRSGTLSGASNVEPRAGIGNVGDHAAEGLRAAAVDPGGIAHGFAAAFSLLGTHREFGGLGGADKEYREPITNS